MSTHIRSRKHSSDEIPPPQYAWHGPDSLIVHVLFIDLVGYSKLSMEKQEKASSQLADTVRCSEIYRSALAKSALTCLDTGDGMALVFEGDPTAPAFAALDVSKCRGAHPSHPIRMGMHSGPAMRVRDINDRQNFKGVGVNIAQRVMDCGDAGQIMMTEHYASILRSYEGWSAIIVSRGLRTVKHGVKLRVCELLHEHAPTVSLTTRIRKDLPLVPGILKWTGILLSMASVVAGFWSYGTSHLRVPNATEHSVLQTNFRTPIPQSKLTPRDVGPRFETP